MALMVMTAGTNVAYADEIKCTGTLGQVTVDNVLVPQGKTCTLNGTWLEGIVKVTSKATLYVKGAHFEGNIQADSNAKLVSVINGSFVDGDIQIIKNCSGAMHRVVFPAFMNYSPLGSIRLCKLSYSKHLPN